MQRIDRTISQSNPRPHTAAGIVAVEFLLSFPIAFLFLLGIVEFGLFLTNIRHVDDAAFQAAREAARLDRDDLHNGGDHARYRANRVLHTAGIGRACVVMIEHNVSGGGSHRQIFQEPFCHVHPHSIGPLPQNKHVAAVRCTVIVPMRHLAPDLLSWVGFSLKDRYTRSTVTVPYHGHGHDSDDDDDEKKKKKKDGDDRRKSSRGKKSH